jgi:hypothetical protein
MRKRCGECHTTTGIDAPYCTVCGHDFDPALYTWPRVATWKGRFAAVACGLLAAVVMQAIYS